MIPKLRLWYKNGKSMYYGITSIDTYTKDVCGMDFALKTDDCIFMQSTGQKDKNGKEIYEGDILIDDMDIVEGAKHVVEFCYGSFCEDVESRNGCDHFSRTFPSWRNQEVIGNIYENPDLLEDKKCSK